MVQISKKTLPDIVKHLMLHINQSEGTSTSVSCTECNSVSYTPEVVGSVRNKHYEKPFVFITFLRWNGDVIWSSRKAKASNDIIL